MNTTIEISYFLIPIVISIAAFFLINRLLKETKAAPGSPAFAGALAFFVGYWLLPDWAPLVPNRSWHYLPYLGLLAALVGPLAMSTHRFTLTVRWLAFFCVALLAAWFLVPSWPRLQPVRLHYVVSLATYLFTLAVPLQLLANRVPSRTLLAQFVLSAVCVAVAIAAFVSLSQGHVAGVAAASMFGCWLASLLGDGESLSAHALIPLYAILVGGIGFVGYIELDPPLTGLLLAPAAPLLLWLCELGPLARLEGTRGAVVRTVVVVAWLACAVLMAIKGQASG